jgi:hypothetical protein
LTDREKTAIVARAEKRKIEEGKETTFYHFERKIDTETLKNFKRRKRGKTLEVASPIIVSCPRFFLTNQNVNINSEKPRKIFPIPRRVPSAILLSKIFSKRRLA